MSEKEKMILLTEALEILEQELAGISLPVETIPVRQALGRTVVEDQISSLDIPPFDKSAMDGYAVLDGDQKEEYRLVEVVPAGKMPGRTLEPGTTIKVMTGAPVPEGAGQVIMVEQTSETDGKVRIISHSKATNICPRGEDINRGNVVLHAPTVLGPLEIANLIAVGITEVKVTKPIRIAILATGSEIVDSPAQLGAGKIMNSNGPMLAALCRRYGLQLVSNSIVRDNCDITISAIRESLDNADIVLLSGGVSEGDFDFVSEAMKQVGLKLHFNRLAIKPGKPMTFASGANGIAFGLPGNPVAVYLMFHLFVLYAARLMVGKKHKPRFVKLPLAQDYHRRRAERMAYLPCRLTRDGLLKPITYHGSAHLQALRDSDGFFIVPKGATKVSAGQKVDFLILKGSFQ
ncbi:MAG: molybdopterin molybdotransferase MoeA [Planctomycetota bacterium]|jgi:molybdopterin molybdotransferase